MPFLFAFLGLVAGAVLGRYGGWLYAGLAGLALGLLVTTRSRLTRVEEELAQLREALRPEAAERASSVAEAGPRPTVEVGPPPSPSEARNTAAEPAPAPRPPQPAPPPATPRPVEPEVPPGPPEPPPALLAGGPGAALWSPLRDWLMGGNLLVRVGVIVLFFGVAFLVKLAAEHSLLPIELRLAGVGAGAIVLLVIGWRLRERRRDYALALQGGGVGVLYLTVFAALRLYSLLAPGPAFAVLFVLAAFSAALAVLQNAPSLAVLGASGGFLAPILTATGAGSHVHLFSYYVVLNLGILGVAWFRSWRILNLLGFAFTFVIASAWGVLHYEPALFASTEPFLIAFAVLYVAIAVLYAHRQPVVLRGYVDGTLVFGVPLVGFALQAGLVRHIDYGLAWSAVTAAAFYVVLARWLFWRLGRESRLLAEAFLAIGVVFATLTVPLALDARWTAGMWALEGAALVWVGGRQGRRLPRASGYLLQIGAGLAFVQALSGLPARLPVLNGVLIGALVIALAGLFTAWLLHRRDADPDWAHEVWLGPSLLIWGLAWWYGAWLFEIGDQVGDAHWVLAMLVLMSASSTLARWLQGRLDWPRLNHPARALLPVATLLLPITAGLLEHPFAHQTWLGWLLAAGAHLYLLWRDDRDGLPASDWLHAGGLWLALVLVSWELAWLVDETVRGADTWWRMAWGLTPAAAMTALWRWGMRLPWPVAAHSELYLERALLPVGFYLWAWVVVLNLASRGAATPLPYLPVLNPMDIAVALVLGVVLRWLYRPAGETALAERLGHAPWVLALTAFLWINAMWFRTAHHWLGVGFSPPAMLQSQTVQAGLAILWGLCGLGCMLLGTRRGHRRLWLTGAGLMAAVVAKLFLVDLSGSGTPARIVSFMSVGVLLLVVGYLSPVPPRPDLTERSQ